MRAFSVVAALLLAPALCRAALIVETTFGEFGDTFASRSLLPPGVDRVSGAVTLAVGFDGQPYVVDDDDFIALTDPLPGSGFSVALDVEGFMQASFSVLDAAGGVLASVEGVSDAVLTGTVPPSGELVIALDSLGGSSYYLMTIDVPRVPEPATASLLAAGLALLASLRRGSASLRSGVRVARRT